MAVPTWLLPATRRPLQTSPSQPQAVLVPGPAGVTAVDPGTSTLPVTDGAVLHCPYGGGPGRLNVIPATRPANEGDAKPIVNISGFGICCSLSNPAVAATTAAALGALTPVPCVPATTGWSNASSTGTADGRKALQSGSTLTCAFGGTISIVGSAY